MINIVIPAAGEATRLRPLTSNCSKAMVRIHGKPAIEYIIESIYKNTSDVNEIVIVDGKHDDIREWVERSNYKNIKCIKQGSLNGPRDAIHVGIQHLTNKDLPLVVWLGDAIILDDDLPLGTDFLLTKEVEDHFAWCMWDGQDFFNKPKETVPNAVALVGLYSFKDGFKADFAFSNTYEYDISFSLEKYARATGNPFTRVNTNKWYDIGDIASYHRTCAEFLTFKARTFNSFKYDPDLNVVTKVPQYTSSFAVETVMNEKKWYAGLNSKQRMFVPKILDNDFGLSLSYESGTLLSDLFIHENVSNSTIDYLIEKVVLAIRNHFHVQPSLEFLKSFGSNAELIWKRKTIDRLSVMTDMSESTKNFYIEVASMCMHKAQPVQAMHGDLHFGNILYNPYNDSITLLDPRGEYGKHIGCGGDHMYDLAKLSHDLYHGYNSLFHSKPYPKYVRESFRKIIRKYYPKEYVEIIDGGALLIATCIPLHYDNPNRQKHMREYVDEYANSGNRY
jgi:dTDP-glucose pyrophosphorylase/fructosamine-3-kinase